MLFEIILFSILSIFFSILSLKIQKKPFDFNRYKLKIKGYKVIILMAVIQITAQFLFKNFSDNNLLHILALNWVIYIALLYVSVLNINKSYMMLFFMGTLLNFIVIAANGFKMPVYIPDTLIDWEAQKIFLLSGKDLIHTLLTENTKFKLLSDIITLYDPYPFPKTISIGDVFLLAGVYAFWQDLFFESAAKSKHNVANK